MLLPTPDMPTSACVRPGASRARRALTPQPSRADRTIDLRARGRGDRGGLRDRVACEVALRAHDQDLDAAAAREARRSARAGGG